MALVKKRTSTTRLFIVAAVIIVVAGIGYFLFQQFFLKTTPGNTNAAVIPGQRSIITNFGESILNDSRYLDLKPYGVNLNVNANDNPGQPHPFQ